MPNTDKYSWPIPTPGGSPGTWGDELNTLFDDHIEERAKLNENAAAAAQATADAALPKAGGVLTGELDVKTTRSHLQDEGNSSGTVTLDQNVADVFRVKAVGNITFAFSNITTGHGVFVVLELEDGGAHTITWPGAVVWGGDAPTLKSTGVDILVFYTRDGGTTIYGKRVMGTA